MDPKELADEIEADAAIKPLVKGIKGIADHVEKVEKRTADRVEELAKDADARYTELNDKTEKGFEDVMDRLGKMAERSSVFGRLPVEDVTEPCKAVLSDTARKNMGEYVALARSFPKDSNLSKPEVAAAASEWFRCSTKSQLSKFAAEQSRNAESTEKHYQALQDTAVHRAALQEDTAAEGGNLVPTIVESEVQRLVLDSGRVFPLCSQVALTKKVHKVPAESAAVSTSWVEEEGALGNNEPTFSQLTLQAEKLASRAKMSIELVEDSNVSLLPFLLRVFSEKMARELDLQVAGGDGSGPVITGIVNGASVNAITSGTAAGRTLTYDLLVQTYMGASESNTRDNGVWICSPSGFQELLQLTDGNGRPLVSFSRSEPTDAPAMTLFGKRVIETNSVGGSDAISLDNTTSTATKILFGPLQSYLFGTRQGMRWDVTDQVGWANYQMDARLVGRFAGVPGVSAAFSYLGQINTA